MTHVWQLTVRERFERFCDPGSFAEFGATSGVGSYDADGRLTSFIPANLVAGVAEVDGRSVVVSGDDFTVRGGSAEATIPAKSDFAERIAIELGLPHIRLVDGMGGHHEPLLRDRERDRADDDRGTGVGRAGIARRREQGRARPRPHPHVERRDRRRGEDRGGGVHRNASLPRVDLPPTPRAPRGLPGLPHRAGLGGEGHDPPRVDGARRAWANLVAPSPKPGRVSWIYRP